MEVVLKLFYKEKSFSR